MRVNTLFKKHFHRQHFQRCRVIRKRREITRRERKYISHASQIFHSGEKADVRCLLVTFDPLGLKDRCLCVIYINLY